VDRYEKVGAWLRAMVMDGSNVHAGQNIGVSMAQLVCC